MTKTQYHYQGRYIAIAEKDGWEFTTRTNATAVVVIVPVTDQQELVLVEQFRIPVDSAVLELPAGLVGDQGDPDERLESAAARELEEETGYQAAELIPLLTCPSSAGLTNETIAFFLARGLTRVGPGGGDDSEDIQVHRIKLDTADAELARLQSTGLLLDPKIYAALHWLNSGKWKVFSEPATTDL